MLFPLCATTLLAWSISGVSARDSSHFTISTPFRPRIVSPRSPNRVTTNIITLQRSDAISRSSEYLAAIRKGNSINGVYSRLQVSHIYHHLPSHTDNTSYKTNTSLLAVEGGSVFLAPIIIGGQAFNVVIDTGSSDTWLNAANLTCIDEYSRTRIPTSDCKFGPSYTLSPTANLISTENFNISYADGEFLNGDMLYENMTFAGISISQQHMGLVNYAAWNGDSISSGLVGLAYPTLTNAYNGTNPNKDVPGTFIPYNPLFTTLYTRNLTSPIFSLALQRAPQTASLASGGLLALGGIPSIHAGISFSSTPIAITGIDSSTGQNEYNYYTISISGWALAANRSAIFDVSSTNNPRYTPLIPPPPPSTVIVDSGTSLLYAPASVVQDLALLFSPPATLNQTLGLYTVDCAAKPPTFGVVVGTKVFFVNQIDLVVVVAQGVCVLGVQENGGDDAFTILGDVFLRNVLMVFDVGGGEVRLAAREFWGVGV